MTPDANKIMRETIYNFWDDILQGEDIENPGFHNIVNRPTKYPQEGIVPEKNREAWLQAMNTMAISNVFSFTTWEGIDENGISDRKIHYRISKFNGERFMDFCNTMGIDLVNRSMGTHTAILKITAGNRPSIYVDGTMRYDLPVLHSSTLVKMLKIALQMELRGAPLTKDILNKEADRGDVKTNILDNSEFHIGENVTRLEKYRYDTKIPEILDKFYVLTSETITAKRAVAIDDDMLEKLKSIAEYTSPIKKKRNKKTA